MADNERFTRAAAFLSNGSNGVSLTQADQLAVYAWFKQATVGPCTAPKPSMWDFKGNAKWSAWKALRDMPADEAQRRYIEFVSSVCPNWDASASNSTTASTTAASTTASEASTRNKSEKLGMGPVFSMMARPADDGAPVEAHSLAGAAAAGALEQLRSLLDAKTAAAQLDQLDESGLAAIHHASDRGQLEAVRLLLEHKASVNVQDSEGQTALHYAALCDHPHVVSLLLEHKADTTVTDNEGQSAADVAGSDVIVKLLSTS